MNTQTLSFIRRGERISLSNVPPERTLLEVLREDLGCTGTKEGCGEGDCGACTVVLGEAQADGGHLSYRAINSCIRLAHSINGMALWTVEDIAPTLRTDVSSLPPEGAVPCLGRPGAAATTAQAPLLHPVQQAMVQCHASQCGFCTPGFVMSLFGIYQNHVCQGQPVTRELAQAELSGNLCRCTGYRPIFDAAQAMGSLPRVEIDEAELLQKLKLPKPIGSPQQTDSIQKLPYQAPTTLPDLLAARAAHPEAQLVAGCTDVGLWVTKQHKQFAHVLDVTRVAELRRVEQYPHHIAIGAAVTLSDAFAALVADRPQLQTFARRFAGLPVRNSGTLGGNVANGSPIGDSMPLLIALGANVVLMSTRGHREMPLENLYTGYRQNVMAKDEVLAWIKVPKPQPGENLKVYKISKRFDDDISAVCLAIRLHIHDGKVTTASIGAGGVAAVPARAIKTEASLAHQIYSKATIDAAMQVLRAEFHPLSDMRASAAYRTQVLGNLLQRYWLESQGVTQINLDNFTLKELA